MGERNAPPNPLATAASKSIQSDVPVKLRDADKTRALFSQNWPPRGWPMFSCVTEMSGMTVTHDRASGDDTILQYELTITDDEIFNLEIYSGIVTKDGHFSLSPAIGIRFAAREDWFDDNPQNAVLDVHVRGQQMIPERGLVLRVILAMTFIISRIDRGLVPDLKRVLKTYRL